MKSVRVFINGFLLTAIVAGLVAAGAPAAKSPRAPARLVASGFLYLGSEPGESITNGQPRAYTEKNARIFADYGRNGTDPYAIRIEVDASSGSRWSVELGAPRGERLDRGVYSGAMNNGARGGHAPGIDISGEGHGCSGITGRFVVDRAEFGSSGEVRHFRARFRQFCESSLSSLYGVVGINVPRPNRAPTRPRPIRATLTLHSDRGDYIGQGGRRKFVHLRNAVFAASASRDVVRVGVQGNESRFWSLEFRPVPGRPLVRGVYADAIRSGDAAAGQPGLDVGGEGRGCNRIHGRFVVHTLSYGRGGVVKRLDIAFEQHCEGAKPALRGRVTVRR